MSAPVGASAPAFFRPAVPATVSPSMALSAKAAPFVPGRAESLSDAEKHFSRCAAKLRALRADCSQLREELNQLFDQLLSENYNRSCELPINIRPEVTHSVTLKGLLVVLINTGFSFLSQDVCTLLKHTCSLVPLNQEHLVVKFCQLVHHLLNQLKVRTSMLHISTAVYFFEKGVFLLLFFTTTQKN